MATNKERLAKSLLTDGKKYSWEEYGEMYSMKAEAARRIWMKVRFDKEYAKSISAIEIEQPVLHTAEFIMFDVTKAKAIEGIVVEPSQVIAYTENPKEGTANKTVTSSEEVESLEDLVRVCKIDTEIWDITRYSQKSSNGKYTVEAFMSKKEVSEEEVIRESLVDEIKRYHESKRLDAQPINIEQVDWKREVDVLQKAKKTQLLELAVFDLHLGKLSWKGETGEDYDMNIAVERYKACIKELLDRTDLSKIDRILLPLGNDMIHIDNKFKTTTNGTPQDTDSRFTKIVTVAKKLMIETIEELSVIAPVDVMIIPGNHDQTVMFTLGEILSAFFWNNEDVIVYNDPKLRKYYKYGQNMIMFTHGSEEKHADLGLIAATEAPQLWASTKFREVHLGHLHKSKSVKYTNVDEYPGFKIRIINSLSGTDAWHYSKGYMSLKGAEAFIWDSQKGLITNHFYNL